MIDDERDAVIAYNEQSYHEYAEAIVATTLHAAGGAIGHGSETIVVFKQ